MTVYRISACLVERFKTKDPENPFIFVTVGNPHDIQGLYSSKEKAIEEMADMFGDEYELIDEQPGFFSAYLIPFTIQNMYWNCTITEESVHWRF